MRPQWDAIFVPKDCHRGHGSMTIVAMASDGLVVKIKESRDAA
jgi:hypothetical protein